MRKITRSVALAALLLVSTHAQAPFDRGVDAIQVDALKAHVYFLAADEMKGRDSLSPEGRIAANYVASYFMRAGLKAIGERGTYFQHFPMVQQRVDLQRSYLKATILNDQGATEEKSFVIGQDYTLGRNGPDATVDAPLVFGGYGDDDLKSVDVEGKVVLLMLREPPGGDRFGGRMNIGETKSDVARKQGAAAILTVRASTSLAPRPSPVVKSGPISGSAVTGMRPAGQDRMTVPHMLLNPQPDVPTAAISERVADVLLAGVGNTVAAFRAAYSQGTSTSMNVPGVRVQLRRALAENTVVETRNVVGMIEGNDPKVKDEYVLITAHYDHVGAGGPEIFRGADDNASGTAAAIAIAEALASGPRPGRSIAFLVFDAEEDGMLGSEYYARHPLLLLANAVAVLNMDMIGRDEQVPGLKGIEPVDNAVNLVGTLYSPDLRSIIERANASIGLGLDYKTDTNGSDWFRRSDHISFAARGIPIVMFNTGEHPDYHTPNDTLDRINYSKLLKITRLVYMSARSLAAPTTPRPRFVLQTNSRTARPQPR
jgi:hypothetical protein